MNDTTTTPAATTTEAAPPPPPPPASDAPPPESEHAESAPPPPPDAAQQAAATQATQQAIAQANDAAKRAAVPFRPTDTAEMFRYAAFLANSNLIPRALQRQPADVLVVLLKGQDLGLSPMQSISGINVIDGKAEVGAQMMIARIMQSGLCEYFEPVFEESDHTRATYVTKRRGGRREIKFVYTVEQADRAGLLKKGRDAAAVARSPWNTQRETMLRRRCGSMLAREVYPDICAGLYDHDELRELRDLEQDLIRTEMEATRAGFRVVDDREAPPEWFGGNAPPAATSAPASEAPPVVEVLPAQPPPPAPAPRPDPMKERLRKRVEAAKPAGDLFAAAPPPPPVEQPEVTCTKCDGLMVAPPPGKPRVCDECARL